MVNYYGPCDEVIKAMNKAIVELFGRLKATNWEKANIIRTVAGVYRDCAKKARRRYWEMSFEAYILAMMFLKEDEKKAQQMAEKSITMDWVDEVLESTDYLTLYRFNSETERKAYRLAEQLEVSTDRNRLIDKAMKEWSRQIGQYAINFTDYAVIQAFEDARIETVRWLTVPDERRCSSCGALDGKEFDIHEIPTKPHYGCRCRLVPIR